VGEQRKVVVMSRRRKTRSESEESRDDREMGRERRGPRPSRHSSSSGYAHDIVRPYTRVTPNIESGADVVSLKGYSPYRTFQNYPYSSHLFTKINAVVTTFPDVDWGFGGGSSAAIGRLQTAQQQLFVDTIQYIQDKHYVSTAALSAVTNFTTWMSQVSSAYCCLRGLQSVIESPAYNSVMMAVKAAVYQYRIRLEADLDLVLNYPLPAEIYDILDSQCGVKKPSRFNTVKISVPGFPKNSSGIAADLTAAADIDTMLSAVEAAITALNVAGSFPIITDIMRQAYPTRGLSTKGSSEIEWEYDCIRFQAVNIPNAGIRQFVPDDQSMFVVLASHGVEYPPQYMSLLRTTVVGYNNVNLVGLLYGLDGGNGLTGMSYCYDTATWEQMYTNLQTVQGIGATDFTDVTTFEFPWAVVAITPGGNELTVSSLFNDYALIHSSFG